jgi:hypothetical protein
MVESNCRLWSRDEFRPSLEQTPPRYVTICINPESCKTCKKNVTQLSCTQRYTAVGHFGSAYCRK